MKLKDLKVSTQLLLCLGAIFVLVAILSAVAWFQAQNLWHEAKGLYEHPFTVRIALGEIKSDAIAIHREMKDLNLADTKDEIQTTINNIDAYDAHITQQMPILYQSYLGPRADIDNVRNGFVQWKSIRNETIRLLQSGNAIEANKRTRLGGVGDKHATLLQEKIEKMSAFAKQRGRDFYHDAQKHKETIMLQLGAILSIIILMMVGISLLLYRRIRDPLKELAETMEQFRQGNLDARSHSLAANEFGTLSNTFNEMAESFQLEIQIRENAASLTAAMLQVEALHPFCQTLLTALLQQTGSQIGAVYLLNEQKTHFEHFESIGLASGRRAAFAVSEREGEFGNVLATKKVQHIANIPAAPYLTFTTVSGDFRPMEIITIPVISNDHVVAVISLSSIRPYSSAALRLVDNVLGVLTARLNGVLVLQRIRDFSQRLEHQNQELEAQKTELALQGEELSEQNIELELQKTQLDQASRLKSSFLSNMSHELRTPLNSVIALAGVLNRRLANSIPAEEYSYLEVIERNGKNLLELINDVLDLSRIESGLEEIRLRRFSVRELVSEVVEMIAPQAREKNIALLNDVMEDLPPIRSDLIKCRHILQNLIANAVKFTPEGSVEIRAALTDNAIQISVTDTGIGIAENQIPYIFDEFRQADESMTRIYGGTGLGLTIARKYVTLLQGSISVQSTLGKGSTFTCTLPLTVNASDTMPTAAFNKPVMSPDPSALPSGQGKRILIVEDNAPAVIQLTDILTAQGYRIQVANNGREAIAQIEKALPDAMILDLMMPEVDGFGVLKAIRSMEKAARIPVLILTAKHVTTEELSFLKGNHIHQLIQKGDINKAGLLAEIGAMVNPPQEPTSAAPSRVIPLVSDKPIILVAEDDPDNLKTIRALLEDSCTVIIATNGQEALDQARARTPDLILMDISMPVMDGFNALAALRRDEAMRHIPVVAVTASAMAGNREQILAHGFNGYLSKSIDWKLLEETINQIRHAKS